MNTQLIKMFENKEIRTIWINEEEKWYFSIIDVISVLTATDRPRKYWNDLKRNLIREGSQLSEKIGQLKMKSSDGKNYKTDVADLEQIFRLIQSIPSKKVEPLKLWLAEVGKDRINEIYDPELTINRALETYVKKGYSEEWINRRLKSIDIRKEFTNELKRTGIDSNKDFAILTNILTQTWSGLSVGEYKKTKNLTKDNLRDHMTNIELILSDLAELSSTEISKSNNPQNYKDVEQTIIKGGMISKNAKNQIERETGKSIISSGNNKTPKIITDKDK